MATALEMRDQRARLWEQSKDLLARSEGENRDLTAEENETWQRLNNEMDSLAERIKRQEDLERRAAETRNAPPIEGPEREKQSNDPAERAEARHQAFEAYIRHGFAGVPQDLRPALAEMRGDALSGQEQRALGINVQTAAGYLVDDETRGSIEMAMLEYGGMRSVATVFSTSTGGDYRVPTMNDTGNVGELVGEHQPVTTQDVAVGMRIFRAYMYSSKRVLVSIELLQDSAFDIGGLLTNAFGERIGRITNTHFTTGAGMDRPTGIIRQSVLGVTANAQAAVTADELMNLTYTIDRAYRAAGRWMWHSLTEREVRKLVDGNGQYLWGPGLTGGAPNTLLGYPITINDDMPQMATGNIAIEFGDLRKYWIRDVMGFRMLRLEELYAENGQVAFLAYSRHDGGLLDAGTNPVKHLVMA